MIFKKLSCIAIIFTSVACGNSETNTTVPENPTITSTSDLLGLEKNVSAGNLSGTYLNAGTNTPIVVIVPGSGPTDRDGNNRGMESNALKFLARGLAGQNISSIRVDKRGMFASKDAGDGNEVTVDIYAVDYRKWAEKATELSGQDCAFLLGHSEGGLMVSAAAAKQDNICGVITLAAPGRRLSDVLREQLTSNPANTPILDDAMTALKALENQEKIDVSGFHPALVGLFNPAIQGYLISLFSVDPAEVLASLDVPSLVVQGEHDIQVSADDARRLAEKSGAELVLLPGVNHVLKPAPEERMANILTYNSPTVPIDPLVTDTVAKFINKSK